MALDRPAVDEGQILERLRLTPGQRLDLFTRSLANLVSMLGAAGQTEAGVGHAGAGFAPLDLLRDLARHGIDPVVVGDVALVVHGSARIAVALEVVLAPGAPLPEHLADDPHLHLARTPPEGPDHSTLRRSADEFEIGGMAVRVASIPDLIGMKQTPARPKDLADVAELEAILRLRDAPGAR